MKIPYYPGCTIKTSARNYEASAMAALHALGFDLHEMEDWNCCGVVHALASDDLYHQIAPVRVLTRLHKEGQKEVVTLCDMCYNTLSQANHMVASHPDRLKTLNTFMECDTPYDGSVTVHHLLGVLRDRIGFDTIKKKVKQPLRGLNIFPYYGCMLLRPGEVSVDTPEDPTVLGDLLHALGATIIDDPVKIECCGSHHTVGNRDIVYDRVEHIVARAKAKGANAMVMSCPLCRFNLDTRQSEIAALADPLPVFYFTQLMGIALGVDEAALGLDQHRIDPRALLESLFHQEEEAHAVAAGG